MGLGALDTPENVAARVLAILPRAARDRARYAEIYGPEMAEKAESLRILLHAALPQQEFLSEDTPANRAQFAKLLAADPELIDRLAPVLLDSSPFRQVLTEELDEISRLREVRLGKSPTPLPAKLDVPEQRAVDMEVVGLAFSGGGIRSATFNLGVLQAFAERKVLRRIDYLSTVSGGGYIGSWLVSWIHKIGIHKVEQALSPVDSPYPQQDEVRPIEFLRDFSNYLAPRPGMFSADTWTILAVWSRNTFLNLLILIAAVSCVLLVPRTLGYLAEWILRIRDRASGPDQRFEPLVLVATLLLLPAIVFIAKNLKSFSQTRPPEPPWWQRQLGVIVTIVLPVCLACFTGSIASWSLLKTHGNGFQWGATALGLLPAALLIGLMLLIMEHVGGFYACFRREGARRYMAIIALVLWPILAMLAWLGLRTSASWMLHHWTNSGLEGFWRLMVVGPPLMLVVFTTTLVLHEGLMGNSFPDDRREWLSRLGAWLGIVSIGLTALCFLSFYGPWSLAGLLAWGEGKAASGAALAWLGATFTGLLASRNRAPVSDAPTSAARRPGIPRMVLATLAPYVFIGGLLVVLSSALTIGLGVSACDSTAARGVTFCKAWTGGAAPTLSDLATGYWDLLSLTNGWWSAIAFVGFVAIALLLAYRVDINEFSLHHFYKNRLVRCYLGACRGASRQPDPFTGFDTRDDRPLATLRHDHPKGGYSGPVPHSQYDAQPGPRRPPVVARAQGHIIRVHAKILRICERHHGATRRRSHPGPSGRHGRTVRPARLPADRCLRLSGQGRRRGRTGAGNRNGYFRSGRFAEHGLPIVGGARVSDDYLRCSPRLVARQPVARLLAKIRTAFRSVLSHGRTVRTDESEAQVRVSFRRRPLRKPRIVRTGPAPLLADHLLRRGTGRGHEFWRPRQCDP